MSDIFEPCGIGIEILLLPTEITIDIISRLPFDSILQCRQVCKTWRNVIYHPSFTHALHLLLHRRRRLDDDDGGSDPAGSGKMGFIFLTCFPKNDNIGKELHYVEYDVNDGLESYSETTPSRRINMHIPVDASYIVGSCNGLICISLVDQGHHDASFLKDPIYICNPIIGECVNLPRFQQLNDFGNRDSIVSGFGYIPSTNEYKVVRIYYPDEKPAVGMVEVYTLGGSGNGMWRKKGEVVYYLQLYHHFSPGIFANGELYWLEHDRHIVAFNLADEEFRMLPPAPWFHPNKYQLALRLFQGSLCVVCHKLITIDIWSLKKNDEWECMFTINTRLLDTVNRSWARMWCICVNYETLEDYIMPFAHTENGRVLLCYRNRFFGRCNPEGSTFESIVDLQDYNLDAQSVVPHMNNFVSLRALLEEEDGKMIVSVEGVARIIT